MSTVNGLPAHALLVHFIVVLAPLTAILAILCAVWPAARGRLVWLVAALSLVTAVLTPLTTEAGEWLGRRTEESPLLERHEDLGDTMLFVAAGLVISAALVAFLHLRARRDKAASRAVSAVVAVVVAVAGIGAIVQVYRIGDSGAKSVWGDKTLAPLGGGGEDAE